MLISLINSYDAIVAFHGPNGFRFGLGNVVLLGNVIMLWVYTVSCHSCRHVTGGRLKHFSKHPIRYWIWTQVSRLNTRHKQYAWITLIAFVVATDSRDHVWVFQRPRSLSEDERGATLNPPRNKCCAPAPSVIRSEEAL